MRPPRRPLPGTEAAFLAGDGPSQGGAFVGRFFRSGRPGEAAQAARRVSRKAAVGGGPEAVRHLSR